MWEGSVRTFAYLDQLKATAIAGFTGLGLTPSALHAASEQLRGTPNAVAAARDHGIELHLDTVTAWAPIRVPARADAASRARFDHSLDECWQLVDTFGLRSILAVAVYDLGAVPAGTAISGFRDLCQAAASRGLQVFLEFMPFWGIPDAAAAQQVLEGAQCANAGLMLDTWHFQRGSRAYEALRRIAAFAPVSIQVGDGPSQPAADDLAFETTHYRKAAGEGDFPLTEICLPVVTAGGPVTFGPEVFSDVLDTLRPAEAGELLGRTTKKLAADLRLHPQA